MEAAFEYAMICFNPTGRMRKNFVMAERYFTMAADGGHATAQYVLGYMYKYGLVKKDAEKAIMYLEKARNQGNSYAALELVSLYQEKDTRNYQRAYECAEMAASHAVGEAEYLLANMLFMGQGCDYNVNKAYELYARAYEHGIHCASVMMKKIESFM